MLDAHALPRPDFSGSPSWVPDVGARWRQNDTTSTNALYYPLDGLLPGACTLDEIHVYLTGSAGHGALPGTMPRWVLNRRALATGIDTAVQTQPDASGTTGAYQARHTIDGDGIDETIDRTSHSYYLEIDGEYGTNSQDGLLVDSIKILYHVDHGDEGAA
jgi:hypothetical protein